MISSKSDFIHIFNEFIHIYVYSPGARAEKPLGDKLLMSTEGPYHFDHLLQVSNKSLSPPEILYTFFNVFPHVYSPGARAENPLGTNFWCQQKALIISTICCKFQTNLFHLQRFYTHFLMFFHMYIAPGQGQKTPWGQTFDVSRKPLSLRPFVASFKQISFNSFFYVFPHVYSPRAGADNPLWTKSLSTEPWHFLRSVASDLG